MYRMQLLFILVCLVFILTPQPGFGQSIVLNGAFGDWSDKPALSDPTGDEAPYLDITEVRWYPDNEEEVLYFYAINDLEAAEGLIPTTWRVMFRIQAEGRVFKARATVNRINRMVTVSLFNSAGRQIWSGKGKWADAWGKRVECGLPLNRILTAVSGGYELTVAISSGEDAVPDQGEIVISSINTYARVNLLLTGVLIIAGQLLYRRKTCSS